MADETIPLPMKRCTRCGEEKPASREFFSPNASGTHGLQAKCKPCFAEVMRERRKSDPEGTRAYYNARNAADPHLCREQARQRYAAKKAHYRDVRRARRQRHIDEARAYHREWQRAHRRTVMGAVNGRMSGRLGGVLRAIGNSKAGRAWRDLVGYGPEDLRSHLERQFSKGMSWDNMEEWHIDHRVPLSSFAFTSTDDPEFKAAWALTNLQPLWKLDNLSKGAKRLFLL